MSKCQIILQTKKANKLNFLIFSINYGRIFLGYQNVRFLILFYFNLHSCNKLLYRYRVIIMIYAYIRVSTKQQNIDRQYEEIKALNIDDKYIYIDKESGKDFDRVKYQKLIKKLKKDDLLIIKSIDRLGRNYQMILEEWSRITKTIGADIKVLDMPLLDTRIEGKNLVGKFISDIVLQVLSFVAENERINIKQRQAEGIRIAKAKGVKFGRPKVKLPVNTNDIIYKYKHKELTNKEAIKILGISRGTFFRVLKKLNDIVI